MGDNEVVTAIPAPEGYELNFDNPQQQKVLEHYLVFGIGGTLATIALCQRYYTKLFLSKGLQIDDGFMFLAWACAITTQAMLTYSISNKGMCTHVFEMPLDIYAEYLKIIYISAPVFMLCNGFTKLSLLSFYLHISPQKWFRTAVWISIGIVTCYTIGITLSMFFMCQPIQKAFDITIDPDEGHCLNAGALYIATAVSNIVTDIMLFLLPIPMVLKLKMSSFQKIGAIIIFGIGSMTVATSVVRLGYLPPTLKSNDPAWDAAPANVWTFVEANLFVICGSMPTLRKFFKHFAPRLMGAGSSADKSYGQSYGRGYGKYGTGTGINNQSQARKQGKHYEPFPEETELQDFDSVNSGDRNNNFAKDPELGRSTSTRIAGAQRSDPEGDDVSDKAILQTKTFTVQYESHK